MTLQLKIVGNIQFGSVLYPHTLYQIEVNYKGQSWFVYRRYSEFDVLHQYLLSQQHETLKELFPEKALLSIRNDVVNERMAKLQIYLSKVVEIENIENDISFQSFLDFSLRGKSGASSDLPPNQIVFETVCQVKRGLPIEMWSTCFVVLTKQGTIYVLRHIYDKVSNPLLAYSISNSVHMVSPSGTKMIQLQNKVTDQKLYLRLQTDAQLANWLRTLAEFTTRNIDEVKTKSKDVVKDVVAKEEPKNKKIVDNNENDVKKSDDLSSMYGV